jgi:hypothetical protein
MLMNLSALSRAGNKIDFFVATVLYFQEQAIEIARWDREFIGLADV